MTLKKCLSQFFSLQLEKPMDELSVIGHFSLTFFSPRETNERELLMGKNLSSVCHSSLSALKKFLLSLHDESGEKMNLQKFFLELWCVNFVQKHTANKYMCTN